MFAHNIVWKMAQVLGDWSGQQPRNWPCKLRELGVALMCIFVVLLFGFFCHTWQNSFCELAQEAYSQHCVPGTWVTCPYVLTRRSPSHPLLPSYCMYPHGFVTFLEAVPLEILWYLSSRSWPISYHQAIVVHSYTSTHQTMNLQLIFSSSPNRALSVVEWLLWYGPRGHDTFHLALHACPCLSHRTPEFQCLRLPVFSSLPLTVWVSSEDMSDGVQLQPKTPWFRRQPSRYRVTTHCASVHCRCALTRQLHRTHLLILVSFPR